MQTIVTHSGSFDPDDVLAVASVQLLLGVDEVNIIRSREEDVISKADWAIDVGGRYDLETKRFDHHQNGVPKRSNGVPYSAFGLIWKEYGVDICGSEFVAEEIEKRLVFPVDAADNHMKVSQPRLEHVVPFEFFDVVDSFRPVWDSGDSFDTGFLLAVDFARNLLLRMIAREQGKVVMRKQIEGYYNDAEDKRLLVVDHPIPRYHFSEYAEVKLVVSPVPAEDVDHWMAVVIPHERYSFDNRASFPAEWSGLADGELSELSRIKGALFCHKERYIFVAKTKAAALEAAELVLNNSLEVEV